MSGAGWDFIVIGAGSAGCALVHNLVRTGKQVLLIEAGGDDRSATVSLPFLMLRALDVYDWGYRCEDDATRLGRSERWQRGRLLGGTSSVNGMIYVRGADSDFDLWASESDESWSARNVRELFKEIECCDPKSIASGPEQRGFGGPLRVRMVQRPHRTTRAFVDALIAKGHPYRADYNAQEQEGVGYTQLTQRWGRRFSAYDAFVRPHLKATNLTVMSQCLVKKITIDNGRATGVTVEHNGVERSISGTKVILSAGSLSSPQVLMLSGVGDPAELARHGIAVTAASPMVGRTLMEHPIVRITYDMRVPTYAFGSKLHSAGMAAKYLFTGQGLLASPHEATAFLRSSPDLAEPDIQFHIAPIGVAMDAAGLPQLMKTPSVFISIKKNRPESRGEIRLRSASPADTPIIDARLLDAPADPLALVNGIEILRDVMATDPMAPLVRQEHKDSAEYRTKDELHDYVRKTSTIACHSVGTCRMGNDPDRVADARLRVRGVENLWIADASVMPYNISGNTNAATMMIGYKLGKELAAAG